MCGIVGFVNFNNKKFIGSEVDSVLLKQVNALSHRGPDDSNLWINNSKTIGLGHTRLAIQDISLKGAQPMFSKTGRFVMVFNGEIYNHLKLRNQLNTNSLVSWVGDSDTETLLQGFEEWGVKSTILKSKGMFSFAVYDKNKNLLTISRDRCGEKPLHYCYQNGILMFASELKALKINPHFNPIIDKLSLQEYLQFSYIKAPRTIYKNTYKLIPGSILNIDLSANFRNERPEKYWDIQECFIKNTNNEKIDPRYIIESTEEKLLQIVSNQMISDRTIGAFLSGGIDSSTVVALMQSLNKSPVNTFTIGFENSNFNEAHHAKHIANHLGTNHIETYISDADALSLVPNLSKIYDEPFADASQIPTLLLSQITSKHVTVVLSGDAGDELFCGYNRYYFAAKYWSSIDRIPECIRQYGASFLSSLLPVFSLLSKSFKCNLSETEVISKLQKTCMVLKSKNIDQYYINAVSKWRLNDNLLTDYSEDHANCNSSEHKFDSLVSKLMLKDYQRYLPDDILCKVDRASMSASLETRIPFLDHELIEFVSSLPLTMKFQNGQGKWLLRQIAYKYIPRDLLERPKKGFSVPISSWLRGPLREWAECLLSESNIKSEEFFVYETIKKCWEEHISLKRDHSEKLWIILMFQSWLQNEKN